jgi:hypothetical protein
LSSKFILQSSARTSDLRQRSVGLDVGAHQLLHEVDALLVGVALEAEGVRDRAGLKALYAEDGVDGLAMDRFRVLVRHFLDVHASLRGGHDHRHAELPIESDAEVELLVDVESFFDEDLTHDPALGAGLVRDQGHAEHLPGQLGRLVGIFGEFDAAAFAAAAGVDLRLHHHAAAQLLRGLARLVRRFDNDSAWCRHAVAAKDLLRLIFMDFHGGARFITECRP